MPATKGLGQNGTLYSMTDAAGQLLRIENGRSLVRIIDPGGVIHLTQQGATDLIAVLQIFASTGNIS